MSILISVRASIRLIRLCDVKLAEANPLPNMASASLIWHHRLSGGAAEANAHPNMASASLIWHHRLSGEQPRQIRTQTWHVPP